jgi:predicted nucleic acid-binding Zn ribbon protein
MDILDDIKKCKKCSNPIDKEFGVGFCSDACKNYRRKGNGFRSFLGGVVDFILQIFSA